MLKELRKKKKKHANLIILLLILFVLFYVILQDKSAKVSSEELVSSYSADVVKADKLFLHQDLKLVGKVKSFFQFEGEKSLFELRTANDELKLYYILMNKETEEKASILTAGTPVTVYGKCLGIKIISSPTVFILKLSK